jgi:hypothetical protein
MATIPAKVIQYPEPLPEALPGPIDVDIDAPTNGVSFEDGALKVDTPDGGVVIDFNPDLSKPEDKTKGWFANLADQIDEGELASIASQLLDGIQRDEDSRQEWMAMRAKGITMLGLKLEDPSDVGGSASAPLEGMSRIRHPLLTEATVRFQANARGELLPAAGPVKVRNDMTLPPKPPINMPPLDNTPGGPPPPPMMGHNGGPNLMEETDNLADVLETDFNHYLTVTATEYVPDTDRMLFYVGFGGDGFKKVFNCPLRRRPVSESVDAEDLIVSNSATDLQNCGRVTHKIKMRKSILKRMQIAGGYRDVPLGQAQPGKPTEVDVKKAQIAGQNIQAQKPEDEDYTVYETYCELDLDKFAPKHFKGKGLPLPYRVTIEKDSRQVLSIIRNWDEDDEQCLAKRFFVQFPFIRGLGFYGLGFIHLLGNLTTTLTAAWREMLDAGMFANFPGFLVSKGASRQLTNQLRVPPGGSVAIDLGPQQDIRSVAMALPYKEPGPSFTAFVQHVAEEGQRLASTAEVNVGEGKQDAPVGTTLALIEQATKVLDAVHKRLHQAQSEEFMLLKDRFKEDPEAFWRHRKTVHPWKKEEFLKALENNDLVPVADPNNPTSLHRMAKAHAIMQLSAAAPQLYNTQGVHTKVLRMMNVDAQGLFNAQPTPPPPDPRMEAIKEKAKASQAQANMEMLREKIRIETEKMRLADNEEERNSREKIAQMQIQLELLRIEEEKVINERDDGREESKLALEAEVNRAKAQSDIDVKTATEAAKLAAQREEKAQEMEVARFTQSQEIERDRERHQHEMAVARDKHEAEMQMMREKHAAELEQARLLAKAKASAIKKAPKGKSNG